jgi:hypothetical protein
MGLAFYGDRLVDVDAHVSQACGIDPNKVEHLRLAAEVFGEWTAESIKEAEEHPFDLRTNT